MKAQKASLVFGLLITFSSCPTGNSQNEPTELLPNRSAVTGEPDEAYFLVRTLEVLYGNFPQDLEDPSTFEAATFDLRSQAINLKARAESVGLPIEIVKGYADFVKLLDSFMAFLTDIGAIQRKSDEEILEKHGDSAIKGGVTAGTTFSALNQSGNFTNTEAAAGALLMGGFTYAINAWSQTNDVEASRQAELRAAARRMDDISQATLSETAHALMTLAARRGWSSSELGWNLSVAHAESIKRLIDQGDLAGLIKETSRQAKERPRDPFIQSSLVALLLYQDNLDSRTYSQVSDHVLRSANFIPSAPAYNYLRQACLAQASFASLQASVTERVERELGLQSTLKSRQTLELAEKAFQIDTSDPTGQLRLLRSIALLENNDLEAALNQAQSLPTELQSTGLFRFIRACIFSRGQMLDEALVELEAALKSGEIMSPDLPDDPNLMPLKSGRNEAFQRLVTPRWFWTVTDDWVFDDVVLQNDSAFPLTNVTLTLTLIKGEVIKTVEVTRDVLMSGDRAIWQDAVAGVSGHWDLRSSSVTLKCDQVPGK